MVAIVCVALTAGACGSGEERAAPSRESRPPKERANVARKVVERGVEVAWSTPADSTPVAVTADARGVAVIVDHERVGALDLNGKVLWATELSDVVGAAPALTDDRVVVPFTRANGSGGCIGLDRETGEVRWRYEAIVTAGIAVARAGAIVICVMGNGQTAGIAPTWGAPLWELTFAGDVAPSTIDVPEGTPIAVDESTGSFAFVAQIGPDWQLTVRSIATGLTRFHVGLGSDGPPSAPALTARGFFGVASGAGDLAFVRVRTQEFVSFPIPASDGFDPTTPPLRVDGVVIVAARAGEVTAFDLGSSRPRWTAEAEETLRDTRPVVLGTSVMLQTWLGGLIAFRLADGRPVRLPADPGRAVAMIFSVGPRAAIAVGQDGDDGWVERWETQPGR